MTRRARLKVVDIVQAFGIAAESGLSAVPSEYQITARQLRKAQDRLEDAEQRLKQCKQNVTSTMLDLARGDLRLARVERARRSKECRSAKSKYLVFRILESPNLLVSAWIVALVINFVIFAAVFAFFRSGPLALLIAFITTVFCVGALVIAKSGLNPSEEDVVEARTQRERCVNGLRTFRAHVVSMKLRCNHLAADYALQEEHRDALKQHQRLLQIVNSQRYKLLNIDWKSLRGIPFEDFVADVFELLGFRVQKTKATGDQGLDIIAEGKGQRIGIQCKGYGSSVGNHAVQEAHAGKSFYGCTSCAVISNTAFTRGAIALAAQVNCQLIDDSQIVALILGRLV